MSAGLTSNLPWLLALAAGVGKMTAARANISPSAVTYTNIPLMAGTSAKSVRYVTEIRDGVK
jgi:hypothetical protein